MARVQILHGNIAAYMRSGPPYRRIERLARRTANAAKRRAPVDTGTLRASIAYDVDVRGDRIVGTVYSPLKHAVYQHEGTGIYGPRGRVITPKRGRYLVFAPKGNLGPLPAGSRRRRGGVVFAKKVRGTPPNPFLLDALQEVSPWPVVRTPLR